MTPSDCEYTWDDYSLLDTIVCMDALQFLRGLPDNSIDMVLTSPPYDNLRTYNGYTWDFEGIAQQSYRVLKPGGVLVWVIGDATIDGSATLTSFKQALYFKEQVGFRMHQRIIWEKLTIPQKRPKSYLADFEDIFIFSKGEPSTFNPCMKTNRWIGEIKKRGHSGINGFSYADGLRVVPEKSLLTNVWKISVGFNHSTTDNLAHQHPAIFPEKLAERHILTWSNPGDIVLDYFIGSGTTAKMAWKNNRHYIGCDLSPEYVQLARQRLATCDPYSDTPLPDGSVQLSLFGDVPT